MWSSANPVFPQRLADGAQAADIFFYITKDLVFEV
jgi:hypothetical protein